MARLPRYDLPGLPQHVIQRGNNRGVTFCTADDFHFYKRCLKAACTTYGCRVHAYVLMNNHVHLLLTPRKAGAIGRVMQSVGRRYVRYFNDTYERSGTLWEGRYRATLIDSDRYLLTCYRYIELNPVRAGMTVHPADYTWSSYRGHAHGESDALITEHSLYLALAESADARAETYRALVTAVLDAATLDLIRESTNKGWLLGSDRFEARIASRVRRRLRPLPHGGIRQPRQPQWW